jgi:biotin carboxyl carrier protein
MKLEVEIAGRAHAVEYTPGEPTATVDGMPVAISAQILRHGVLSLLVEDRVWRVVLEDGANESAVHIAGERIPYRVDDPRSLRARRARSSGADGPKAIKASMPGRVVRLLAQKGETVEAHQGVVVIEAMKMQNEMRSPKPGMVAEMRVIVGATVAAGDVLAVIE